MHAKTANVSFFKKKHYQYICSHAQARYSHNFEQILKKIYIYIRPHFSQKLPKANKMM